MYYSDNYSTNGTGTNAAMDFTTKYYRYNKNDLGGWDSYGWSQNRMYNREFTGAVISYYSNGELIGEEEYDFCEENQEKLEAIRQDLMKQKQLSAKKAVYRLTDVQLDGNNLVVEKTSSDGSTLLENVTRVVLDELKNGVKRTVYLFSNVADFLAEQDPTIFDGWEVVLCDKTSDVGMTDMPKSLEGFQDETTEEFVERIRTRTKEIHQAEDRAVREAETDKDIEMLLSSF